MSGKEDLRVRRTKKALFAAFVELVRKKTIDDLKCNEWHGEQRKMPELLKVMKDYEAYCYIIDDNKH
jgi:hypothetical protein